MCGIGGILRLHPVGQPYSPMPESWLDAIDERIAHRGPDDHGRFRDHVVRPDGATVEVGLVHRRLSIIDHATGRQPMVSEFDEDEDSRLAVVFNGCIYNHGELREELEGRGHVFESDHSDTEVLLHAYRDAMSHAPEIPYGDLNHAEAVAERWLLTHVDGMYAFALWDRGRADIVLGRDYYGKKPLYIARALDGVIVFASTVPAVRAAMRAVRRTLGLPVETRLWDEELVDWIALGYGSATPFEDIEPAPRAALLSPDGVRPLKVIEDTGRFPGAIVLLTVFLMIFVGFVILATVLLAAAIMLLALLVVLPVPPFLLYKRMMRNSEIRERMAHIVEDVDALLESGVVARLEADAPVGCFLSGGLDSSLIAHYAQAATGDLTTICVRMQDERYDESEWAAAMADFLGTNHITLNVSPTPADDLIEIIHTLGLPFGDSSILPTYWVSRAASEHVKVALSGDGGDELFLGYDRYRAAKWLQPGVRNAWMLPEQIFDRSDPKSRSDRLARLAVAAKNRGYTDIVAIFPKIDQDLLLGRPTGRLSLVSRFGGVPMARRYDLEHYLPDDLLRKVDTASMMCGLEVRCPFLSRDLRDVLHGVPPEVLTPGGERKGLLKQVALRHLPPELIDRPKMGFAIPLGEWFRTDYGGMRTLLESRLRRPAPFGPVGDLLGIRYDVVHQLMDQHMNSQRDHSQRLFVLLSLSIWSETL